MLHRQRVLLRLLGDAGRPVSGLELTKWSFLLRMEAVSAGGSSFYDFVPYQQGPFSFALYQELDKLASLSYVRAYGKSRHVLDIAADGVNGVARDVAHDVARVIQRFGRLSRSRLLDYVYSNYPAYTFNSTLRRVGRRPRALPQVFTAGYEGRSVDAFLNLLLQEGVRCLIDVRRNPVARRYGFHRSTLNRLCGKLDIEYEHIPSLGVESEKRRSLGSEADYETLFEDYRSTTLTDHSEAIDRVVRLVTDRPSVLVCMEADPARCHRSRLGDEVARRTGLPVRHLGWNSG